MRKLYFALLFVLVLGSCKQPSSEAVAAEGPDEAFVSEELPSRVPIDSKAMNILKDWPEFNELDAGFDAIYKVENNEELILTIENLLERQNALAASAFPEIFDLPQVRSRLKVLKTYILKVKAAAEYRIPTEEPTMELIKAYNALRNQFAVIMNSELDTRLMFEE